MTSASQKDSNQAVAIYCAAYVHLMRIHLFLRLHFCLRSRDLYNSFHPVGAHLYMHVSLQEAEIPFKLALG